MKGHRQIKMPVDIRVFVSLACRRCAGKILTKYCAKDSAVRFLARWRSFLSVISKMGAALCAPCQILRKKPKNGCIFFAVMLAYTQELLRVAVCRRNQQNNEAYEMSAARSGRRETTDLFSCALFLVLNHGRTGIKIECPCIRVGGAPGRLRRTVGGKCRNVL